jgi:hypothetical protein
MAKKFNNDWDAFRDGFFGSGLNTFKSVVVGFFVFYGLFTFIGINWGTIILGSIIGVVYWIWLFSQDKYL